MRNPLRWSSTFPAVLLSLAGVIGVVAGVVAIRGSLTTTGSVTAAGSLNVAPSTSATGFDAGPMDGASAPVPVVTAGSVSVLESAWDINDKTARTIGWRLRTEGAAGDSSNAPTTKLLIQSTADNSTWTTRATLDMAGLLAVTGAITGTTGTFSGDIKAAGGYRTSLGNYSLADIPANSYRYVEYISPYAGSWAGLTAKMTGTISTGTITCTLFSGSTIITGHDLVFTSADGSGTNKTTTIAKDEHRFDIGYNTMQCKGSADLSPTTVDITGMAVVEF